LIELRTGAANLSRGTKIIAACIAAGCLFAGGVRADEIPGESLVPDKTKNEIWTKLKSKDAELAPSCQARKALNTKVVKTLADGNWAEQWTLDRCGVQAIYTLVFTQGPNKNVDVRFTPPNLGSGEFPGETLGSPVLMKDTWAAIQRYDQGLGPACQARKVLDTKVVQPAAGGEWTELWTIDRCGDSVPYTVKYTSDPKGGTKLTVRSGPPDSGGETK
jgi:hypothetical protein